MNPAPRALPKRASARDNYLYQEREEITRALTILGSHSLLMRYAVANQQSIPATRFYFEKILLNLPDDNSGEQA